jgi:hypothetical protein
MKEDMRSIEHYKGCLVMMNCQNLKHPINYENKMFE